jgi:hypothetical protein
MPLCPRCRHPAEQADTICTQCGFTVPAETKGEAPSLAKTLLLILLVILLGILLILVLVYSG